MPNRIIRESILTSEAVCSLGWPEEVFYRRLMSIVDDYGRHEANPQLLRSKCYPLQTDAVRVADISRWIAACVKAGLVVLYEVQGKQYLEVSKFGQQQRSASKCPAPPIDAALKASAINCYQVPADAHLGVFVGEGVSEEEPTALPVTASPQRASPCPTEEIIALYHKACPMLPRVEVLNDSRRRSISARWREVITDADIRSSESPRDAALEWFGWFFGHVARSAFLTGKAKNWRADFDFLMTPTKFAKVVEGSYHKEAA